MENQFTVSLWGDEAFSAILSLKSIPEIVEIIARDTSPPLYNLTEHLAFNIFGPSEVTVRGLSFLYYLIAIFFTYKIAAHIWNPKASILAALLAFFNPFFFIYAFEGRMYAILAAGVIASIYFFLSRNWIGYVVATTVALYSHHFSIFALIIQGCVFLLFLTRKKQRHTAKGLFLSFIAIGILYLPWLMPLYNQTKMVGSGFWLSTPNLTDLRIVTNKLLAEGINHEFKTYALYIVFIILLLRKWNNKLWQSVFLGVCFLGPIIMTWVISQKFSSVFYERYLLYTVPPAMILLATNTRKISFILATALLLPLFMIIDFHYFTHPTKRPFKQLAAYVSEHKKGDDYLLNWNGPSHFLWESKFYGIPAPIYIKDKESPADLPFFVGTALMTEDDIVGSVPGKTPEGYTIQRVGVITVTPVEEVQLNGFSQAEVHEFADMKFIWLEKI